MLSMTRKPSHVVRMANDCSKELHRSSFTNTALQAYITELVETEINAEKNPTKKHTTGVAVLRDLIASISEGTPEGALFKAGYSVRPPPQLVDLEAYPLYKIEYSFQYVHKSLNSPRKLPTMSGYLEKKGTDLSGTFKGVWKRRFCRVLNGKLVYSKEKGEASSVGFIDLSGATFVNVRSAKQPGGFQLITNDKVWFMRAEDDEKREEWLKCLQRHANVYTVRYKKNPNEKEGSLEKMHPILGRWNGRHVVVRNGCIFVYKTEKICKKMSLYRCSFKEYKPTDISCRSFIITAKNAKTLILRAKSETEMHEWINTILRQKFIAEEAINSVLEDEIGAANL